MRSMTGFGAARVQNKDLSLEVSIRTVNGRYLETRFHLPREYMPLEGELKKTLSQFIQRGTVDVFIQRKLRNPIRGRALRVNKELVSEYLKAYKEISKDFKLNYQVHLEFLARLPDVVTLEETSQLDKSEENLLRQVFAKACKACDGERDREGKALRKDLEKLLGGLEKQVQVIAKLRGVANEQLQEKFESKIRGRLKGAEMDPQRLSQEIVIQLEKADINEELARLSEHTKNYRELLRSQEAEGKKLDFYTQELLREVNTIGSKSQVAKITQAVVEAKTLIERLREQVQNVQ